MTFTIIIPAHNEAATLSDCLESLFLQTYPYFEVMVVNDGSQDETQTIIDAYCEKDARFHGIALPKSEHQPGAKVVNTFNEGLSTITPKEIICKFDADIIFPQDYLEKIVALYQSDERLGMASGIVYILKDNVLLNKEKVFDFKDDNNWQFESISSKNHVRGPIKSYRKECFMAMNGLRSILGWDNIDVMLAQMNGFTVRTLPELWVKHLRPTAHLYRKEKYQKLGKYFRNIGLSFPLAALSAFKVSLKDKNIISWWIMMRYFLTQPRPVVLSDEEIRFIRKLRWKMMGK